VNIGKYMLKVTYGLELIEWVFGTDRLCNLIERADLIITAGNGGEGCNASHMAGELMKGIGKLSICLTDSTHVLTAYSNDCSYEDALAEYYERIATGPIAKDAKILLMVYSGSGGSENIVRLIRRALELGGMLTIVAVTGYRNCAIDALCREVPSAISINFSIDPSYPYAMQVSEDLHMVLNHILFRMVMEDITG